MAKLIGAAKKLRAAMQVEKESNIFEDEQKAKFIEETLAMLDAIESDEPVTFVKVKADKNQKTPAKLTFVKMNTANKITAKDAAGVETALIRTAVGNSLPKEVSNVWRISNTTARYEVRL